ncbi:TPA: thymidylate kinase [Thermoplasmata archaeon]|nr:thymidylate kinase [Thermoplasmata archaeon]
MKRLIVVDGLDGCGKDTHAQRILGELASTGRRATMMKHPSQRFTGRLSKRALLKSGPVAAVFAAAFHTADVLVSVRAFRSHQEGDFVFVRYLLGTAYLPRVLAPSAYLFFRKLLPFPDLALFIDIEPSVALERIERRDQSREMFETREKLVKARDMARSLTKDEWVTIDNTKDGEGPFIEVKRVLCDKGLI